MISPECEGLRKVHIPAQEGIQKSYLIDCPTCEGTGEISDRNVFANNCPACGEPIKADEKWCDFHKGAEQFDD
ncbi:MAG: hypothetical protein KA714_30565 [Limnoraphis sp. WC205]|jgi:hypothetical protein|nr:hypothetical protein [Limnoraphis sp. WC205]